MHFTQVGILNPQIVHSVRVFFGQYFVFVEGFQQYPPFFNLLHLTLYFLFLFGIFHHGRPEILRISIRDVAILSHQLPQRLIYVVLCIHFGMSPILMFLLSFSNWHWFLLGHFVHQEVTTSVVRNATTFDDSTHFEQYVFDGVVFLHLSKFYWIFD